MQVFGLQGSVYRGARMASRLAAQTPNIVAARREAVRRFEQARRDGLSAVQAARAVGCSRATLNRWAKRDVPKSRRPHHTRPKTWTSALIRAVEHLREHYPMWGKAKLGPLLRDQGFSASDATIGRILKSLMDRGRVQPASVLRKTSATGRRRPRTHAKRLPKGLKPKVPGGLIQIDTVFITIEPGKSIKHFTAYDPIAKWTVAKVFNRATATSAALFLDKVIADMPFPIQAIQVDGGSEFKAEFEEACKNKAITLYDLPPKSPEINGAVERCNGAWRYEFYAVYDLPSNVDAINPILDSFQHIYNHIRPHGALAGKTPACYLKSIQAAEQNPSHMY
jgi:transposase InsO family protein